MDAVQKKKALALQTAVNTCQAKQDEAREGASLGAWGHRGREGTGMLHDGDGVLSSVTGAVLAPRHAGSDASPSQAGMKAAMADLEVYMEQAQLGEGWGSGPVSGPGQDNGQNRGSSSGSGVL